MGSFSYGWSFVRASRSEEWSLGDKSLQVVSLRSRFAASFNNTKVKFDLQRNDFVAKRSCHNSHPRLDRIFFPLFMGLCYEEVSVERYDGINWRSGKYVTLCKYLQG